MGVRECAVGRKGKKKRRMKKRKMTGSSNPIQPTKQNLEPFRTILFKQPNKTLYHLISLTKH